jgi:hypothetical protein
MTTPGAQQGVVCIIAKGASPTTIVGQGEFTLTVGGAPVDITNKSSGGFMEAMDGVTTSQSVVFAGTIVYNSDIIFEAVRAEAWTGTQDDYTITYGATGESYAAKFTPTGISDALPSDGNAVMTTVSFNSSGVVTRTPHTPPV